MDEMICGLPEALVLGLEVRRNAAAKWFLAGDLAGLGRDYLRQSIAAAFGRWSAVAGCSGEETTSEQGADIVIRTQALDGPMGVLADCMLPGPRVQVMRLDTSERWTIHAGPGVPQGKIDIVRVLTHELGHFWGIGHIGRGNLMAPTYSDSVERPQPGDEAEMVARYGPPQPSAPPPGSVDLPAEMHIVGQSGRVTAKYRLERVG